MWVESGRGFVQEQQLGSSDQCSGDGKTLQLTAGQAHDGRSAADMFDTVQAGHILLGDRAYDSDGLREDLRKRGAWACVRPIPTRVNVPSFSPRLYRQRNVVERAGEIGDGP